jgi:hypothetical protein
MIEVIQEFVCFKIKRLFRLIAGASLQISRNVVAVNVEEIRIIGELPCPLRGASRCRRKRKELGEPLLGILIDISAPRLCECDRFQLDICSGIPKKPIKRCEAFRMLPD